MAQIHAISGTVVDADTGEQLHRCRHRPRGHVSGHDRQQPAEGYGYFSLVLPAYPIRLHIAFIGYDTKIHAVHLNTQDVRLGSVKLQVSGNQLHELVVSAAPGTACATRKSVW